MRNLIGLLVVLLGFNLVATAKDLFGNPFEEIKGAPYVGGIFKIAGGYIVTKPDDNLPSAIQDFDEATGFFTQFDMGAGLNFHFGYARVTDDEAQANIGGGGLRNTEYQQTRYQYGLKVILPVRYVNPYVGAGYITGTLKMTDKTTNTRYDETLYGAYWHAGLDILFSPHIGLRLGYQEDNFAERVVNAISDTKIDLGESSYFGGLLFYY